MDEQLAALIWPEFSTCAPCTFTFDGPQESTVTFVLTPDAAQPPAEFGAERVTIVGDVNSRMRYLSGTEYVDERARGRVVFDRNGQAVAWDVMFGKNHGVGGAATVRR